MAGFENDVMFAKNADFTQADNQNVSESNGLITNGQLWIGRTSVNAGGTHIDVNTLTAGTGISITNGAGSITIENTGALADLHTARFIVGNTANGANYSTIAAALTAASSGDTIFIQTGTYTENLTLKAGVNLTAFQCDSSFNATGNVIIVGKLSFSSAGSLTISGIQLQTNSDYFLEITGSNASIVSLNNCFLNCSNHTGINFSVSNIDADLRIYYCSGDISTTGITFLSDSSIGSCSIRWSRLTNTGSSTTASTKSAGQINFQSSACFFSLNYSSSNGSSAFLNGNWNTAALNTTTLTTSGTGVFTIGSTNLAAGSASNISIGAGSTVTINNCIVNSSNTNVITGAGTINYAGLTFSGTSHLINTTTQNPFVFGSQLGISDGTLAAPGLCFSSDPTIGMYFSSSKGRLACQGTDVIDWGASNCNINKECFFGEFAHTQNGIGFAVNATTSPYAVQTYDTFIPCNTSGGAFVVNLNASPKDGSFLIVKDIGVNAAANNITINGNGHNIVGTTSASSYVINTNGGSINLVWSQNTSLWYVT